MNLKNELKDYVNSSATLRAYREVDYIKVFDTIFSKEQEIPKAIKTLELKANNYLFATKNPSF